MNDKENIPTTPTRKGENFPSTTTPSHKQVLKPISPNKNPGGRLSFVESDNLDEHFNLLHTTQEEIQQQLHNIELTSKQTSVDLGQLFDRSKNNNENLNKLLQNVVNYSQEVMTEGNATKADMHKINDCLTKLSEQLDSSKNFEKLKVGINDEGLGNIRTAVEEVSTENTNKINDIKVEIAKLREILSTDNELMSSQLTKQDTKQEELQRVMEKYFKESQSSQGHNDSNAQELSEIKSELKKISHDNSVLSEKLPPSDLVHQIISPIVAELKAVSLDEKSVRLLESILEKIDQLDKSHTNTATHDTILTKLEGLEKVQTKSTADLEDKIHQLEKKYALLCNNYNRKLTDYKNLQSKYQILRDDIENIQNCQFANG
ncbi:hypothetical protein G210_4015 [Candida maltosa Xu316]|uniref:Uncharacterized protein n=1 Tax=Candida maltosa (strain Xu316) TaxID=1245528 RepID=M3JTT8_CANMX|nr:hypothetical protein G210_4015 [Candida maltosa Xu316]